MSGTDGLRVALRGGQSGTPGGNLTERERAVLQELSKGGLTGVATMLNVDEARAERMVCDAMWGHDARAYLAGLLDARVVGLLAPKAVETVLDMMTNASSDRSRLTAAQMALQLVGVLGTGGGTQAAVAAAEAQAAAKRGAGAAFEGASARELLAKVEELEAAMAGEGPAGPVIDGAATTAAPEDRLAEGQTVAW